jgi:hypothetical protein
VAGASTTKALYTDAHLREHEADRRRPQAIEALGSLSDL